MKFSLCAFALLVGTTIVQAAPVANPVGTPLVVEPSAEQDGLKVSLSLVHYLESARPHVDVVLQNTSSHRVSLIRERNSWGINDLQLEITSINGKVLDQPLVIARTGRQSFSENYISSETLDPGECTVREIELLVPEEDENAGQSMWLYRDFPWEHANVKQRVTMRAVYSNADLYPRAPTAGVNDRAWMGKITSLPKEYYFYRG